ncbi:demethoxyubiquinone hydroxylase family protein [Brevundimonas sp.]|uniref:demethoxyubiquinone hydroxylase family protein n=1 Tax=Brevundimonas sp. TaxID=1871086 RepID=UPI002737DB0A|nr:demethoxyubiquinone hydroxylase family protein [Brevundimonas sp.]MDP3803046.1 demethoxyubiquinone hydroxylase family protein [Brevundimonas sp.]
MKANTSIAARILRVNHGGEHGAISIYSAQILAARLRAPDLLPFLREALAHERSHRVRFRSLMPARAAKPCRMMWIWGVGGGLLGLLTGLLGREAILACTEAVEGTVHRHLNDQIRWAAGRDEGLRAVIQDIRIEELAHLGYAVDQRTRPGFGWLDRLVSGATEALIWISTRGDSVRLARELARSPAA